MADVNTIEKKVSTPQNEEASQAQNAGGPSGAVGVGSDKAELVYSKADLEGILSEAVRIAVEIVRAKKSLGGGEQFKSYGSPNTGQGYLRQPAEQYSYGNNYRRAYQASPYGGGNFIPR